MHVNALETMSGITSFKFLMSQIITITFHHDKYDSSRAGRDILLPAPTALRLKGARIKIKNEDINAHTIHVWYIYPHWVDFYGKCR